MLDRAVQGRVPPKPHTVFVSEDGTLFYEECLTRQGFDGQYSILYHRHRPHAAQPVRAGQVSTLVPLASHQDGRLLRRHYRSSELAPSAVEPRLALQPLLFNDAVVIAAGHLAGEDSAYFVNGDADDLFFVHTGKGVLHSPFGTLEFSAHDYVIVPKGVPHRFALQQAAFVLHVECTSELGIPAAYRNAAGQLRMDAPFSHRDFARPVLGPAPADSVRRTLVQRRRVLHAYEQPTPVADVVGWDGSVYPLVFPIERFQPRVGQIHLPPTVHTTFSARGVTICSFVPRLLDFHERANPCPYPHASVDVDEVIFYVSGQFSSRKGVGPASISHHPAGVPHGPHPGAYESAPGTHQSDELAVMLDCQQPLWATAQAAAVEDDAYHASFA